MLIRRPGLYEGLYLYTIEQRIEILRREAFPFGLTLFLITLIPNYFKSCRYDGGFQWEVYLVTIPLGIGVLLLWIFSRRLTRLLHEVVLPHVQRNIHADAYLTDLAQVRTRWEEYLGKLKARNRRPKFDTRHTWLHNQYLLRCRVQNIPAVPRQWKVLWWWSAGYLCVVALAIILLFILPMAGLVDSASTSKNFELIVFWCALFLFYLAGDVQNVLFRLRYLSVLEVYAGLLAEEEQSGGTGAAATER